ncbi:MAG: M43 family zinc metalloprotease [Bacteroidota bacterium]
MPMKYSVTLSSLLLLAMSVWLGGCSKDEDEPLPRSFNFSPKAWYISLAFDDYSKAGSVIANGQNGIQLTIEQYDQDKKLITRAVPTSSRILINGKNELPRPFLFTTTTPGDYTFTLPDVPARFQLKKELLVTAEADKSYQDISMPVIFHLIAAPGAVIFEPTFGEYIRYHIEALNKAYADQMGSKDPNRANARIQFTAALKDSDGNLLSTPGLHVVRNIQTRFKDSEDAALNTLIWDGNFWAPKKYINVWVCDFDEPYSWARFPFIGSSASDFPTSAYGVFFKINGFTIGGSTPSILVHEVGHMLNLYHNFNNSCNGDLDECRDTFDYKRATDEDYKGGLVRTSCSNVSFAGVNYMDYFPSDYNTFTFDQRERMRRTVNLCPFLPTPLNAGRTRGPVRSNLRMFWTTDPSTLVR